MSKHSWTGTTDLCCVKVMRLFTSVLSFVRKCQSWMVLWPLRNEKTGFWYYYFLYMRHEFESLYDRVCAVFFFPRPKIRRTYEPLKPLGISPFVVSFICSHIYSDDVDSIGYNFLLIKSSPWSSWTSFSLSRENRNSVFYPYMCLQTVVSATPPSAAVWFQIFRKQYHQNVSLSTHLYFAKLRCLSYVKDRMFRYSDAAEIQTQEKRQVFDLRANSSCRHVFTIFFGYPVSPCYCLACCSGRAGSMEVVLYKILFICASLWPNCCLHGWAHASFGDCTNSPFFFVQECEMFCEFLSKWMQLSQKLSPFHSDVNFTYLLDDSKLRHLVYDRFWSKQGSVL